MTKKKAQIKVKDSLKAKSNRGGARPGAGLPRIEGGKRLLIMLGPEHVKTAQLVGAGNVSKGVRVALEKVGNSLI